jgi:hypothetical protein
MVSLDLASAVMTIEQKPDIPRLPTSSPTSDRD